MGQVAAGIILASLVIAGGMAFPDAKAAAQAGYDGYAYTERLCQEYGQQPRRYQVRDPIAGSDWRNDGGWAIVLEHGSHYVGSYSVNSRGAWVRGHFSGEYARFVPDADGNPQLFERVVDAGVVTYYRDTFWANHVKIGPGEGDENYIVVRVVPIVRNFSRYHLYVTGGAYIRWANMAWCR